MKYFLMMLTIVLSSSNVFAEVDTSDLALADEAISAQTLNIEGQYQEKEVEVKEEPKKVAPVVVETRKPLSASEKIRLYREKLELRNQIMVQKKMEQIRLQQEIALAKKLEQSMNQTIKAIDAAMK